jgi:hypothetical protein
MNFSVLDGWWAEGFREDSGWALPLERTYTDQNLQDDLDAETLYNAFETDIVPTYFDRDEHGVSEKWITYVKNVITKVGPHFTMKRMLDDYYDRFYNKLAVRGKKMKENDFTAVKELVNWKNHFVQKWEGIHVIEREVFDTDNFSLKLGQDMKSRIRLYLDDIQPDHVGVELVFFKRINDEKLELVKKEPLRTTSRDGQTATFESSVALDISGVFEYGYRLYPKHPDLPHRQDLALVKWI